MRGLVVGEESACGRCGRDWAVLLYGAWVLGILQELLGLYACLPSTATQHASYSWYSP